MSVFVATYMLLWLVVIGLALVTLTLLRERGLSRTTLSRGSPPWFPDPETDGPELESAMPRLDLPAADAAGSTVAIGPSSTASLLVFLSPMCDDCQSTVNVLSRLRAENPESLRIIAVLRNSPEGALKAFLRLFELHVPVAHDEGNRAVEAFDVHHAPYALFYNPVGRLVAKGLVRSFEELEHMVHALPRLDADGKGVRLPPESVRGSEQIADQEGVAHA